MRDKIVTFLRTKNIEILDNDDEIINLFLGALIVGKIDYWLKRAFDFIDNKQPETPNEREWSELAERDKAYRTNFLQLDNEVKTQIKKLLRESIEGIVFSILSELDENWMISFDNEEIKGTANKNGELHADLYKWLDLFEENEN